MPAVSKIGTMLLAASVAAGATKFKVDPACSKATRNDCVQVIETILKGCSSNADASCVLEFGEGDYTVDPGLSWSGAKNVEFEGNGVELILKVIAMGTSLAQPKPNVNIERIKADCALPTKNDCPARIAAAVADCKKRSSVECEILFQEGNYPLSGLGLDLEGLGNVSIRGDGAALLIKAVAMKSKAPLHATMRKLEANLGSDRIFRVPMPSSQAGRKALGEVLDKLEVDEFGESREGVDVRVPTHKLGMLKEAGLGHEDTTDAWMAHFRENFAKESFVCQESAEVCANADDFYSKYQLLDAIHKRIQALQSQHPDVSKLESLGTSYEGREQLAITIGDPKLPMVFYLCGEHSREWIPPMFCVSMAEKLLAEKNSLLNDVSFTILPVMNPDGYVFTHTSNNMWRKSRQPNANSTCVGTDLNRNYGHGWGGEGTSSNPCSDIYCGTKAWDNKETTNIKNFVEAHASNMLVFTDVHAYGYMWMNAWGDTYDKPDAYSKMKACGDASADAIKAVHGSAFETGTISEVIYVASGSSVDWLYGENGVVYGYAPEVRGSSFQPDASNIVPSNEELFAGMEAQVKCALKNTRSNKNAVAVVV